MPAFVSPASPRLGPSRLGAALCSRPGRPGRGGLQPRITCFAHTASDHGRNERILRYPDGTQRRIRYPAPAPAPEEETSDASGETWETLNVWKAATKPGTKPGRQGDQGLFSSSGTAKEAAAPQQAERDQVPDSPLQLLRYLTSDKYKASQRELWRKVRESYEVLEGSPWVAPRPLYLLATQQQGRDASLTYTLRTRVARGDTEEELTRVLGGRRRPDGSALIRCSEVRDGVVAFVGEEAAQQYAEQLEAEGVGGEAAEVSIVSCDSHALFRSVQGVCGVVVLLRPRPDGFQPQPHELAASLRGQSSLEEASQ